MITTSKEPFLFYIGVIQFLLISLLANFSIFYFNPRLLVFSLSFYGVCYFLMVLRDKSILRTRLIGYALMYFIFCLYLTIYCILRSGELIPGGFWVDWIFAISFIILNNHIKRRVVRIFALTISFIFCFSIVEYIIYIISNQGVVLGELIRGENDKLTFVQLPFNVISTYVLFPRFQSLTEEPGLVGTLCGFMLFVLKNFKGMRFCKAVIWISGILSFSLAFYAIGFIFLMRETLNNIKTLLGIVLIIGIAVSTLPIAEEYATVLILERLVDPNKGERVTMDFDKRYEKICASGEILFGTGLVRSAQTDGSAGAKVWFYQFGIINFIIMLVVYSLMYFRLMRANKARSLNGVLFFCVFWLSFYQRHMIEAPYAVLAYFSMCSLNQKVSLSIYNKQ